MENEEIKKEVTIDELALMVAKGFNEVNEKIDSGLKEVKNDLSMEIVNAKEELKTELNKKVDIFTHRDLEYRVEKLEEKNGMVGMKSAAV